MVLVAISLLSTSTATALRTLALDSAGGLFPARDANLTVKFGSSRSAQLYSSGANTSECHADFCLEVALVSEFGADPFILAGYSSKYAIESSTFDAIERDDTQPVVAGEGNQSFDTVWVFEANYQGVDSTTPSIDLLLRLRQLSQWQSIKDQLLLHIRAQLLSDHSARTKIDTYSMYGNERIRHRTRRVGRNALRVSFVINKDSVARDVSAEDAYPLVHLEDQEVPTSIWWYTQASCQSFTAALFNCTVNELRAGSCNYESSQSPLIECLRDERNMTAERFQDLQSSGADSVVELDPDFKACFHHLWLEDASKPGYESADFWDQEWWKAAKVVAWLAYCECPFGPLPELQPDKPSTLTVLVNPAIYQHNIVVDAPTFRGVFEITLVGNGPTTNHIKIATDELREGDSSEHISSVLAAQLGQLVPGGIHVVKEYSNDQWELRITFNGIILPYFSSVFITNSPIATEESNFTSFPTLSVQGVNNSKLTAISPCEACELVLSDCLDDVDCTKILPCLASGLQKLMKQQGAYDGMTGKNRLSLLNDLDACVAPAALKTWKPIAEALTCSARYLCNLGANKYIDKSDHTLLHLRKGFQFLPIFEWIDARNDTQSSDSSSDGSSLDTNLNVSRTNLRLSIASLDPTETTTYYFDILHDGDLAQFMKRNVLHSAGDITVEKTVLGENIGNFSLNLTYSNYLLPDLPEVMIDETVAVIDYKPAEAFFEFSSDQRNPFLNILIDRIHTLIDDATDLGLTTDDQSSWLLAPDCLLCSMDLFDCPVSRIKDYTCSYNRPSSPFAHCLSHNLPTEAFGNLTQATHDITDPVSIQVELKTCFKELDSIPNTAIAEKLRASKALACFAKSECPFGPLNEVTDAYQVEIDATRYVQVVRIHAAQYKIGLQFRIGETIFATHWIDSDNTDSLGNELRDALRPSGVDLNFLRFDLEFGGRQVTINIHYTFVMLPDFSISISDASTPSPRTFVDNMILPSSAWIKQTHRLPSKVFSTSESSASNSKSTASSSSGSNDFSSSGSGSVSAGNTSSSNEGSGSIDTESPSNTARCQLCNEFLTDGCRGSEFCQMNMLPCVANSLAMSYSSIVNNTDEVDMRGALEGCIMDASASNQAVFYSWFGPLQSYFTCMARENCPTHSDASIPSKLKMIPGTIEFVYIPPWSVLTASSLNISLEIWQEGPGSSFPNGSVYAFDGNRSELAHLLQYMTLDGSSNITITFDDEINGTLVDPNGNGQYQVRISYGDDFVGFLPSISGQFVMNASTTQPKMIIQPMSLLSTVTEYDWGTLRAHMLEAATEDTSAVSCSQCSRVFVNECSELEECRNKLVPCLLDRIVDARELQTDGDRFGSDTSLTSALDFCARSVIVESTRVFMQFLKCYEAHQCLAGGSSSNSTYLLTTPGRQRFRKTSGAGSVGVNTELSVVISGSGPILSLGNILFEGTLSELRAKLHEISPVTGVKLWIPSNTSRLGAHEFEFEYDGLVGTIPSLSISPSSFGFWEAVEGQASNTLLFTADNSAGVSKSGMILSTLSGVTDAIQDCSSVCEEHLTQCSVGNTPRSLNCRVGVLRCIYSNLSSLHNIDTHTHLSASEQILSCTKPYTSQVLDPVQQFLSCYNASGCPTNLAYADGVTPTYMTLSPANQIIHVQPRPTPDAPVTITLYPPRQASPRYFEMNGTAEGLQEFGIFIENSLDNTAVSVSFGDESPIIGSTYAEYRVDYHSYLGDLPSIDGAIHEEDADVMFWSSEPWSSNWGHLDLLLDRIDSHSMRYEVKSCIEDAKVMSCIPCRKVVLPCLIDKFKSTIDYNSGEFTLVNDETGVEFSYAVRMCAVGLTFPEWAPIGDMMKCFMDYSCTLSTGLFNKPLATYMMVEEATQTIRAQDKDEIELQVSFTQEGSQIDPNAPGYVTISLDRTNNYAALSDLLNTYLSDAGASATVSGVTKYDNEFGEILQVITINYTNFYGYNPGFGSPVMEDIRGVDEHAAKFTFQALQTSPPTWDELNAELVTTATTKVLAGSCANHMSKLLSCETQYITDGSCSLDNAPSRMAWCLRVEISWSSVLDVTRSGTTKEVTTPLMKCLTDVGTIEASSSKNPQGWWYQISDALGGLERDNCPFGQLSVATSDTSMARLVSAMYGQLFTFYSPSGFNATISVNYRFLSPLTTDIITEATTNDEFASMISAIVPPTAQIFAMKMQTDTDTWTFQLVYSRIYLPSPVFHLNAGNIAVSPQSMGDWQVMLQQASIDPSTFASLF